MFLAVINAPPDDNAQKSNARLYPTLTKHMKLKKHSCWKGNQADKTPSAFLFYASISSYQQQTAIWCLTLN